MNLERPLRYDGRLGGHFVLGHVDGVGRVTSIEPDGECYWLDVEIPAELAPFLIHKGSIAVDGISLTIASRRTIARPHSDRAVHLGAHVVVGAAAGRAVNIETDVIGKYVARLLGERRPL